LWKFGIIEEPETTKGSATNTRKGIIIAKATTKILTRSQTNAAISLRDVRVGFPFRFGLFISKSIIFLG
jgi:hypothetical protein